MRRARQFAAQRSLRAAQSRCTQLPVLRPLVVGQHIRPSPSGSTAPGPMIEIAGSAPDPNQGVDAARATEYFAAGDEDGALPNCLLRRVAVLPIAGGLDIGEPNQGVGDTSDAFIGGPGFEQEHLTMRILRGTRSHYGTSGSTADHDDVESIGLSGHEPLLRSAC